MHSVGVFGVSQEGRVAHPFKQAASAMIVWPVPLLLQLQLQALLALLLRSIDRKIITTYLISKEKKKVHTMPYHPPSPFLVGSDVWHVARTATSKLSMHIRAHDNRQFTHSNLVIDKRERNGRK
jgi:hypothetical protein